MENDDRAKIFSVKMTLSIVGSPYADEEIERRLHKILRKMPHIADWDLGEYAGSVEIEAVSRMK